MRSNHPSKRVSLRISIPTTLLQLQQFNHRKSKPQLRTQTTPFKHLWLPVRVRIGQNCQTHHIVAKGFTQPRVVHVHAPRKIRVMRNLNFNVNNNNGVKTLFRAHLHNFVGMAISTIRITQNFRQFRIQKLWGMLPVDCAVHIRKKESQKIGKQFFNNSLPGIIVTFFSLLQLFSFLPIFLRLSFFSQRLFFLKMLLFSSIFVH